MGNKMFFFPVTRFLNRKTYKMTSMEWYRDAKVQCSDLFFAKYYDYLKELFSNYEEIEDVFVSFDRAVANIDFKDNNENFQIKRMKLNNVLNGNLKSFPNCLLEIIHSYSYADKFDTKIQFEIDRKILQMCNKAHIFYTGNIGTAWEYRTYLVTYEQLATMKFAEDGKLECLKKVIAENYHFVYPIKWGRDCYIFPAFLAARENHVECLKLILEVAEKKNVLNNVLTLKSRQGFNIFDIAFFMGRVETCSYLVSVFHYDLELSKSLAQKYPLRCFKADEVLLNRIVILANNKVTDFL